jgi:Ca2+/H+ antiporter, TMEM165/GDT1 family
VDLAVVAAVFPVVFIGELPDKTMFASLLLSTKGRPLSVWLGAAGAFVVHVTIAVTVGVALFHLLPRCAVDLVVAGIFLVGAALALREATRAREQALVDGATTDGRRAVTTAFVVVFLAEWGDLTQVLTASLAAKYHSPASVATGALLALWAVAALAVVGGQGVLRYVDVKTVRLVTAVVLVLLAGFVVWQAVR